MILTGAEINRQRGIGNINIEPFIEEQLNPNSYNYRLGNSIGTPVEDGQQPGNYKFVFSEIPKSGIILEPHIVYLGHTFEMLGSQKFAMSLIGRSSLGRLGLFLQISANLGHTGSCHQWTLELVASMKVRIYPGMRIGQISFWTNLGSGPIK